jgi:competence protein ComEA
MHARRLLTLVALLSVWPVLSTPQAGAQAKPAATPATKSVTAAPASKGEPLDLNTATPDQLKTLPGIGDAYAKRIVDGRPYTMKNQLTQRGILPQATYDKIKDSIVAKRPAAAKSAGTAAAPKK